MMTPVSKPGEAAQDLLSRDFESFGTIRRIRRGDSSTELGRWPPSTNAWHATRR